ncbi:MAG: CotH kinase family protein [Fibrobacter sp.]|nr:CotH kinase family protein [Fibrobacter sp.]
MGYLKNFVLLAGLSAFVFTACSGDESSIVKVENSEGALVLDLDVKNIPDSILQSKELLNKYLGELVEEKNDAVSSSSNVIIGVNSSSDKGVDPVVLSSSSGLLPVVVSSSSAGEIVAPKPELLPPAGFYSDVVIPVPTPVHDGTVRCEVGGAEPTEESSELLEPLTISKNSVVRCYEFKDGAIVEKNTQTYFINESVSMPVVAISVNPSFFKNVYVDTRRCEGRDPYGCPGLMDETEDPIHVEFFENGSFSTAKTWEVDAGIGLMGNYSRTYPKKPVGIKIKKQYNEKKLKYSLFSTRPEVNKFRGFNLRNSGNRFVGDYIGDPAMTSIVEGSSVDYQRSRQVVVFYNGEYYGIHDLRERLNEHFVETNYGIDNNTVEVIKQKKDVVTPVAGDGSYFNTLLAFIGISDFSGYNNAAYEQVKTLMDVGNYADYIATQFYLQNADWPSNNVRAWRSPGQPFKFMLFDTDQSLGWQWVSDDFKSNTSGMFAWMRNDRGEGRTGPGYFANVYIKLRANPDFSRMFANHGAVMMNEYLTYDRLAASVEKLNAQIPDAEITRDMQRFPRSYGSTFYSNYSGGFDTRGAQILKNAVGRTEALREEYRKEFGLDSDIEVTIAAEGYGSVTIDGMKLPRSNYTGKFFGGNDMLLEAVPGVGIFKSWSDGSTENPRLVSPKDGDKFVAIFR